jgi:hypothetical protein
MTRLVQTEQDQWLRDAEHELDDERLTRSERATLAKEIKNRSQIARRRLKAIQELIVVSETDLLQKLTAPELTRAEAEQFRNWQPPILAPGRSPHSGVRRRAGLISAEVRKEKYGTAAPRTRLLVAAGEQTEQVARVDHEQNAEQPES